ncbi:MAG TPA: hypothetical protein DD636_03355, partial [Anaerolineaceae bacterium]|nr:hypothetical protein [Anaerolineaceae bacterium]
MALSENPVIQKESSGRLKKSPLRNLLVTVAAILLVSFIVIMINQAAQLVDLAMQIHPTFGKVLFGFFILLALATAVWTILLIVGLEKPLPIPDETDTEAYTLFLSQLKKRLKGNPYLKQKGFVWSDEKPDIEAIPEAIAVLDEEGRQIIR